MVTPEKNILAVDDRKDVTTLIQACLEPACNVMVGNDPVEALAMLEAERQYTPDLVITDRDMPGMSGEVFAERLQEILGKRIPPVKVPVIVLSARNMLDEPEQWRKFQAAGAVANLTKPFSPKVLVGLVNTHLNTQ